MLEEPTIVYRVNHQDEITYVNKAWLQYRDALQKARAGRPIRFHFRCDAPDLRRWLEMSITMADERAVTRHRGRFSSPGVLFSGRHDQLDASVTEPAGH